MWSILEHVSLIIIPLALTHGDRQINAVRKKSSKVQQSSHPLLNNITYLNLSAVIHQTAIHNL